MLLGIRKRGDRYLRTLLIHGARTTLRYAGRKRDPRSRWIATLRERCGPNIAAVRATDRKWDDVYRRIACRYIDEASADYYLTETKDQPLALIGVDRAKMKVTTWRTPTENEPYSGIWAQRL
jgi:hypothetical protein